MLFHRNCFVTSHRVWLRCWVRNKVRSSHCEYFIWSPCERSFLNKWIWCIGGSRGACRAHATPYGTQFFHFCIHFHRKASALEVHTPLMGACPPTGNPGSATVMNPWGKEIIFYWDNFTLQYFWESPGWFSQNPTFYVFASIFTPIASLKELSLNDTV